MDSKYVPAYTTSQEGLRGFLNGEEGWGRGFRAYIQLGL